MHLFPSKAWHLTGVKDTQLLALIRLGNLLVAVMHVVTLYLSHNTDGK